MKANGIKALDYQAQDDQLVLILVGTEDEVHSNLVGTIEIRTDDDDLVEKFEGYELLDMLFTSSTGIRKVNMQKTKVDPTAEMEKRLAVSEQKYANLEQQFNTLMAMLQSMGFGSSQSEPEPELGAETEKTVKMFAGGETAEEGDET